MMLFLVALFVVRLNAAPLPDVPAPVLSDADAFPAAQSMEGITVTAEEGKRLGTLTMSQVEAKITTGGTKCSGKGPFIQPGKYHSQSGEDEYLDNAVFHQKQNAVFLDIGCNDGITGSNSYYFEKTLGWTGKCVEADPDTYQRIQSKAGRSSGLQIALSDKAGEVEFTKVSVGGDTGLSGIATTLDDQFANKVGKTETIKVKSITPTMLLEEHYADKKVIDYLSIDIEGAEMGVVRSFPFNQWCVNAISVEDNDYCADTSYLPELRRILEPLGFEYHKLINVDQMFVRKEQCGAEKEVAEAVPAKSLNVVADAPKVLGE